MALLVGGMRLTLGLPAPELGFIVEDAAGKDLVAENEKLGLVVDEEDAIGAVDVAAAVYGLG